MLFKLAWRNLWRNRLRTLITVAVIFLAVVLSILMGSMQEGVYEKMIQDVVGFYTGYAQVHKDGYWEDQSVDNSFAYDKQVQAVLDEHQQVNAVVPRLESFALASTGNVTKIAMVIGIDPEAEDQLTRLKSKLVEGTYFPEANPGAVIGKGLARKLKLGVGDTLVLLGQGYHGATAAGKYPVTGLVRFGSFDLNDRIVYLGLADAQELYAAEGMLTSYALNVDNAKIVTRVVNDLRSSVPGDEYEVMDWKEMMPELVQFIEADRGGSVLTMGILYMIISFIMLGTIVMMTAERSYEFGVLVSIGMRKAKLARVVLMEMIMMALMGVAAGMLFMLPIVAYFHKNPIQLGDGQMADTYKEYGLEAVIPASMDPGIFINQGIIVLVFAFLVYLYPFFKIMFLKPVESMKG